MVEPGSAGVVIHLGRTGDILCPVAAVLAYLAVRPVQQGPLFLLANGTPLSREHLVTRIRIALASTGLDVSGYTGHSFRIGAATAAAIAGLSDSTIQLLGRWKSDAFTRYLRTSVSTIAGFLHNLYINCYFVSLYIFVLFCLVLVFGLVIYGFGECWCRGHHWEL